MKFYKAVLKWLSSLLLHGALLLIISSLSVSFLFGNRNSAKEVLEESGVYNKFVNAILDDNIKSSQGKRNVLPFSDLEVRRISNQAFSPTVLMNKSEQVIDAFYDWMLGKTDSLAFYVDFTPQREVFVEEISTYAAKRIEFLPSCGTRDISATTIFDLDCRPDGVPLEFVKSRTREDLLASDFLKDVSLSEQDLPKTSDGILLHDRVNFAPQILHTLTSSLWIFIIIFILATILFIIARKPYRRGTRAYGRDLVSNGGTLIVATFIFGFIMPRLTSSYKIQGGETMRLLNDVTEAYIRRFDVLLINIAIQVVAIGLTIIAIEKISRSKDPYNNIKKKSGVATSYARRKSIPGGKRVTGSAPPIQTSEERSMRKSPKNTRSKRYKDMGL